ncbi:Clp protease N-terminal domain-containing protein [Nonomuraea sp. NPDC050663]|uniref:Clp protease N-terminal domain-containing protein n=1 Tax=Nonomuraea sp. NPDC050663 TaxID=3364370 RepID=UPI00379E52D6
MSAIGIYVRAMLAKAESEARAESAPTIEAQHLLLAMTALPGGAAAEVLAGFELDHDRLREALDREFELSLAAAGIALGGLHVPRPAAPRRPALGATARTALHRGFSARAGRRGTPVHVLLGIVRAETGVVPRALRLAGIDRAALLASTLHALDAR